MIVAGWIIPHRLAVRHGLTIVDATRAAFRVDGVDMPPDLHVHLEALAAMCTDYRDQIGRRAATVTAEATADGGDPICRHETMTTQQAAERIGCNQRNVRDLIARGRLRAVPPTKGRSWQIDAASVAEYMEGRRHDRPRAC